MGTVVNHPSNRRIVQNNGNNFTYPILLFLFWMSGLQELGGGQIFFFLHCPHFATRVNKKKVK